MTTLSLLIAVACLAVLPEVLYASRLFDRTPHAGLALWASLGVGGWMAMTAFFLRLALANGSTPLLTALAAFLSHLRDGHPLRGLGLREVVGLSLSLDIVVLSLSTLTLVARQTWRRRREHATMLDLLSVPASPDCQIHVLDHAQPLAYFLPGDGGRIVVSTGTMELLDEDELSAVLAHERGHRRGLHGHFLIPLETLGTFVRFLPLARRAPVALRGYLEMMADDYASSRTSPGDVRAALGKASFFQVPPSGAFAASDLLVERRIRRLGHRPLGRLDGLLAATVASGAIGLALALTLNG